MSSRGQGAKRKNETSGKATLEKGRKLKSRSVEKSLVANEQRKTTTMRVKSKVVVKNAGKVVSNNLNNNASPIKGPEDAGRKIVLKENPLIDGSKKRKNADNINIDVENVNEEAEDVDEFGENLDYDDLDPLEENSEDGLMGDELVEVDDQFAVNPMDNTDSEIFFNTQSQTANEDSIRNMVQSMVSK